MIRFIRRWFGLRCFLSLCGGKIGYCADGGICWRCSVCGAEVEK